VVGAHQNLNGVRDLTPFMDGLSSAHDQLIYQIWSSSTHYEDTKGDIKYRKRGGLG